jgi:hypothetical protein
MFHLLALVNRIPFHADLATVKAAEDAVEKLVTAYFAPPVELEQLINREHADLLARWPPQLVYLAVRALNSSTPPFPVVSTINTIYMIFNI